MSAPNSSAAFDQVYRFGLTPWGDARIPPELKELARTGSPKSALELGCGVGRFSRYMAQSGLRAVGIDFSAVAIDKARARVAHDSARAEFQVGDVAQLTLNEKFDVSFDVGCFHCLDAMQQVGYVAQVSRLLEPQGTHLIWALDSAPSGQKLSAAVIEHTFAPAFTLVAARKSRRRLAASHWYWLRRQ